jgi:hypothetical protein
MGQTLSINGHSVAAAAIDSLLDGTSIEFQTKASVLTIYGNGDDVGLLHSFFLNDGSTTIGIIPPGSGLGVASTAGKVKTNEDFVIQYAIPAGEHLVHQVSNPTAGAILANFMYVIT